MPIPDLSNKPGPGRPGYGPSGSYDFQFEVAAGQVGITVLPRVNGLRFTIKWQDGTEQAITSAQTNLQSPTTQAGIISINNEELDNTWCDDFAVASGKQFVTKVISWGQNPWNKLQDAFKDCTNLTEISTTSLKTDTTGNLTSLFSGCTGLTEAIIKSWDLSQGARLSNLFNNCTNLEKTDWTGLSIKLIAESPRILYAAGSTTTDGCEFLMSNINLSNSTTARFGNASQGFLQNSKIKANSDLSGWTFPSGNVFVQFTSAFQSASVPASNATINISNWSFAGNTSPNNNLQNAFSSFNSAAGNASTGLKINMSNWNFGDGRWTMESMFNSFKGDQIIGLSTWTVGSGAVYNIKSWLLNSINLTIPSNDNISNSFASSMVITSGAQSAFQNMSSNITSESDWGVFPNLSGANFSSNSFYQVMFANTRFTTPPNLDNVTFHPGGGYNTYESFMASMKLSGSQGVDFTNVTMKPSQFNSAFQQADIGFLKFGSGVDFSEIGRIESFAYLATMPDNTLEFATNLSFGSLTNSSNFPGHKMSVCQTDNFIRRLYATQPTDAGVTSGSIYFDNSAVTESPSVVRNTANLLVSPGGWSLNGLNSTDATMPFVYTGSFLTGTNITPTINTSGGLFSSSDVTVNETTGTFNTSTAGNVTIRYTITATGCYNEQVLSVVPPFTPFKFRVTGPISIKAQPAVAGQNFTIDWGDGSTPVSTPGGASIPSNFTTAGTYDVQINASGDNTYCDEFAIVSGQTNVTEVLDWGQNPWTNLSSAFLNCTNLTSISTTTLTTGVSSTLTSAFRSCTSLSSANISSWNMTNAARIDQMFDACTGLEVMETGSLNLNINAASQFWLRGTGTAVTNGCEYRLNGLNITATSFAASNMISWFVNMKIKPSSSFANISWPSITHANASFDGSSITGVNSTLDCSGWTNYNSVIFPKFSNLTATEGGTSNMKVNITNLSVSSVTSFNRSFMASSVSEIIGLNNLGASAGITNMEYAFYLCGFLSFSNSNFSNAFINSFSLTSVPAQAFRGIGASLSSGSAPPNLGSLNISGISSLIQMFQSAKFSSAPDFSNVVMSTTNPYDFNSTFNGMAILDTSNVDSLFAKTFKVGSFQSTFNSCQISSITMGNNLDLSTCTTFNRMFISASTISDVSFPTNADFSGITTSTNYQYMFTAGPSMSTCSVDNFIRRLHATALNYGLVINFNNAATTETPSVVSSKVADLETAGWTITDNTTDATIPFQYGTVLEPDTNITPTNNTGSAFTGTFTSTNSNIAVNSTTGVINTPNLGNTTIRYTLPNGCFTEQAITIATQFFSYEIDTSLYDPTDLTQSFGFTHVNGQSNPLTQASTSSWNGSIDVDWGDTTSETLTPSDSTGTNSRINFNHTYSTGGTYTIKVNFANAYSSSTDATVLEITGFQSTGGNGISESLKRPRITKVKTIGNTIRIASTKYLTYTNNWALFQGLSNCTQLPSDNLSIYSGYTDSNWHMRTLTNLQKITSAKVGELFTMNASPVTYTQGGGRYIDWVENCYLLETLELKNVNLGRGYAPYIDATSQNCGRDVSVGTRVTIDNINVTDVPTATYDGHFMQQLGFNNANNKIHKDFVCKNIIISNYAPTTAGVGINPMMLGNATVLANNSDSVYINMTNWRMADNSPLAMGGHAFKIKPNIQDISSGSARTGGWEVDLTSTSQWKLSGSYQNKFSYLPSATIKLTGTANWDITGVTSWYVFCWSGTTTSTIIDMDMSGWEVWNTATMNYFINNAKILTSKYDAALIAWNNNVPGSAAAVNIRLGTSNYTEGGAAEAARTSLIETHGWTISDGGPV